MKLLKILKAQPADENMDTAMGRLVYVLKSKPSAERELYCSNIQARMEECSLSDWFSLYIRCIFEQINQASLIDRNSFLDCIANLQLNKLSMEYHGLPDRVKLLQTGTSIFFKNKEGSGYLHESGVLRDEKVMRWSKIHSQPKAERLALFLLVEKVVFCLESMGFFSPIMQKDVIQKMSVDNDPVGVIVGLVPILLELQRIAPDEQIDVVIPILNRVICAIMKLLDVDSHYPDLVSNILEDLFSNHYLSVVDAIPPVSHEEELLPLLDTLYLK